MSNVLFQSATFAHKKYRYTIWLGVLVGAMTWAYLDGGVEWPKTYLPATLSDFTRATYVGNPSYVLFLFLPLSLFPVKLGTAMIVGITIVAILATARLTGANEWLMLCSYPALYVLKMTQIDGLVLLGVAIGAWAVKNQKPYWQGVSTLLLCLKPQAGFVLAMYYLWRQRNWKALVVSAVVIAISFACFGFWLWPWFQKILVSGSDFVRAGNSIGLFPYGLVLIPVALLAPGYTNCQRYIALVAASILASPYAGYHSLLASMAFPLPNWLYILLFVPLVYPIGWLSIIAPIGIVLYPAINYFVQKNHLWPEA